jgi:cardiolipin synthase
MYSVIFALLIFILIVSISLYLNGYFQSLIPYRFKYFPSSDHPFFGTTVASLSDSWITEGKITDFWVGAESIYSARWNAIKQARSFICFETYVMNPGYRADQLAKLLAQKVQEDNVIVYLLADSHGTKSMPEAYWQLLRQAGIYLRFYNPFDWRNPVKNLQRNHRKLLLIDDKKALIGGAGISDRWDGRGESDDIEPWLDYEIAIEGHTLERLKGLFWQHWLDAGGIPDLSSIPSRPCSHQSTKIMVTVNENPSYQNSSIRALFQTLTLGATQRLWLASPYFLPNENICHTLIEAHQRGVDVKVLTMGKKCDKSYVHKVARERYYQLLKAGISIYEYQPSMMHAKLALMDDRWLSFGSANFDPRSFFQNDELTLTLNDYHQELLPKVEHFFEQAFDKSQYVVLSKWQQRNLRDRIIGRFWLLLYWQL